jgi:uncharacterized membrane protein YqjE
MSGERSFSVVLQDIVRNIQEIVRSELRLAKSEIREEASKAKSSALMLGSGVVLSLFAVLFLLLTVVFSLSNVLPIWAAALIVGLGLAIAGGMMLAMGVKLTKRIHPTPERTMKSIKENVKWSKQHSK